MTIQAKLICITLFLPISVLTLAIFADEPQDNALERHGNTSDIHFLLWTRANPGDDDYYVLQNRNLTNLLDSPFNGALKTYFVYHGYNSNGLDGYILQGKTNLLSIEDCNYISVDYGVLVSGANYNAAANNVYVTGEFTASFIDWLVDVTLVKTSNINLIGWSLGAHSAGMTGYYTTSGIIDRITGLDPAGPLFYNVSTSERLDKSQASFVDVIHTNGGTIEFGNYGLLQPVGDIDFYPNGGQRQPGCGLLDNGCDHSRAPYYWVESILAGYPNGTKNTFVSWPCQDWDTFDAGSCTACVDEGCLEMGFHLNKRFEATQSYYLRTNSSSPYALGDVQY